MTKFIDGIFQDVRYALRTLRRNPSFAAIAILVFAVGIGANTAIFSIINAVLFRPPAVRAPHELVYVTLLDDQAHGQYPLGLTERDSDHLRDTNGVFDDVLKYASDFARIGAGRDRQHVRGERVSANYFSVLGVQPALGRAFEPADNERNAVPVIVISHAFWQSALHADPEVLGKQIALDNVNNAGRGRNYTIVGITGPEFKGVANTWEPTGYWVPNLPRRVDDELWCEEPFLKARGALIGRLEPGATFAAAQLAIQSRRSEIQDPPERDTWSLQVLDSKPSNSLPFAGTQRLVPERLALALMMVTTVLLLIAAANLTGVLMARGLARRQELAIRLTLGASRWRIARQLLVEGLLLASAGGLVGVWLSRALLRVFVATMPDTDRLSVSLLLDVPLDVRVVLFTGLLCLLAGCLVSIGPARLASRVGVLGALSGSSTATSRQIRSALRYAIVVPQVCLSLVLLLVSGLLIKTLLKVELTDPGYQPSGLAFVAMSIPGPTHCESLRSRTVFPVYFERFQMFQRRVLETARSLPAVTTVALSESAPFERAGVQSMITRKGFASGGQSRWLPENAVSPGYFETLGIPILYGRDFDARDAGNADRTMIVSQGLARLLWGDDDPIGESIGSFDSTKPSPGPPSSWITVVGVVGDVRDTPGGDPRPMMYLPMEQNHYARVLLARGREEPGRLLQQLVGAISESDAVAEIYRSGTVTDAIGDILDPRRIAAVVLGGSGAIGLFVACLGLYGVVSFSVRQRVREIGIRSALGAREGDILRLIMRDGVRVLLIGSIVGLGLAVAAMRITSAAIVAMPSFDIVTFVSVPLLLAVVVLLACYIPARRAARVDPMIALREL